MKSLTLFKFGGSSVEHYHVKTKRGAYRSLKEMVLSGYSIFSLWLFRHQARKELLKRPDHLLKDMGLTREEVEQEAKKLFWQKGIY